MYLIKNGGSVDQWIGISVGVRILFAFAEERESVDLLGREKFARICRVGAQKENEQEIE